MQCNIKDYGHTSPNPPATIHFCHCARTRKWRIRHQVTWSPHGRICHVKCDSFPAWVVNTFCGDKDGFRRRSLSVFYVKNRKEKQRKSGGGSILFNLWNITKQNISIHFMRYPGNLFRVLPNVPLVRLPVLRWLYNSPHGNKLSKWPIDLKTGSNVVCTGQVVSVILARKNNCKWNWTRLWETLTTQHGYKNGPRFSRQFFYVTCIPNVVFTFAHRWQNISCAALAFEVSPNSFVKCTLLFICLFIHSFVHQWLYSLLMGPGLFFSSVIIFFTQTAGLLGLVIFPSQGRYLHTGQQKHTHEPTISAFEREKTFHALDRAATVIGKYTL
jgi:hypothetical protein